MKEDELSRLFANALSSSQDFASWVLSQTGFAECRSYAQLLWQEQATRRPDPANWWKDWWLRVPGLTVQGRQIDVFACFENCITHDRFALAVENKKRNGAFKGLQAEDYKRIATAIMEREKNGLRFSKFETVLIAPLAFRHHPKHRTNCDLFCRYIPYEDIATHVPEFGEHL